MVVIGFYASFRYFGLTLLLFYGMGVSVSSKGMSQHDPGFAVKPDKVADENSKNGHHAKTAEASDHRDGDDQRER